MRSAYRRGYYKVSIFDFNMRPGPSAWPRPDCRPVADKYDHCPKGTNPGRTHRFYAGAPVLPFGFGLSYTSFRYEVVSAPAAPVSLAPLAALLREAGDSPFVRLRDADAAGAAAGYAVLRCTCLSIQEG